MRRRMPALAALTTLLGALGLTPDALAAQAAPGDTVVLTLEEAIQQAEGGNPAYRQTLNNLSLNPIETRTTWANQLLPNASLSLFSTNYNGNIRRVAFDNFGNPIDNPQSEWSFFSRTSQNLNLTWGIQGADLFNTHDRQQRTNFERELAVRAERSALGTQVERQYYETLEQRELLRMEEELLAARETEATLSDELFRLAQNTRVELLNAEFAVAQQRAALRSQEASHEQAKLALRSQLGDEELGPFRLSEEALPIFDPASLDEGRLVQVAMGANPSVLQAESSVVSQRLGVKEAKNQWWPSLNLNYSISRTAQALEGDADPSGARLEWEAAHDAFERVGAALDARRAAQRLAQLASLDGERAPADRSLRTFLFTDIVGSTRLVDVLGDADWETLRRWHHRTLQSAFREHGGEVVGPHEGDGFFVAFVDGDAALDCATAIQRALAAHREQHGFAPQVRIGAHRAESLRRGGDYAGKGVHLAARIAAAADGGAILVSTATLAAATRPRTAGAARALALDGEVEPVEVAELDWR